MVKMVSNGRTEQQDTTNKGMEVTFDQIADAIEDKLFVVDRQYRIRYVNAAMRQRFAKDGQPLQNKCCYEVCENRNTPCHYPLWACPLTGVLESANPTTIIHTSALTGDSTTPNRHIKLTLYPLRDGHGNIEAAIEVRRDVTEEKELEAQTLRRHHQLSALSQISSAVSGSEGLDGILRIALDNVLDLINGTIGGILLVDERTRVLSYRVQRGLSARYAEQIRLALGEGIAGRVAETGEPILLEDVSRDKRTAHPDLISAEGLKGFASIPLKSKDRIVGVMNVASHASGQFGADDISLLKSIGDYLGTTIDLARLYERLARVGRRNQTLLRHALNAQEEERKRIARELHDETSQSLTSLTLSLQAIIGMMEIKGIEDPELMDKLKGVHAYAVHASHEVVTLMKELRPTLLDELGMVAAINRYARSTLEPRSIHVSTEFEGTDRRFGPEVEVTLFRIAQGAVGNALEHAEAKNVSIRLVCDDHECILTVEDDGKGFDVSKLTGVEPSGRGAGLFTMRERSSMVGGVGYVESKPGHGTKVIVKVPLSRDIADEEDKGTNR